MLGNHLVELYAHVEVVDVVVQRGDLREPSLSSFLVGGFYKLRGGSQVADIGSHCFSWREARQRLIKEFFKQELSSHLLSQDFNLLIAIKCSDAL